MKWVGFKPRLKRILAFFVLISGMAAHGHIVDGESRKAPAEFFAQAGVPGPEAFSASGSLYCGLAGIDVTAQIVGKNNLLLTAAHFFFDRETHVLKKNLDRCFFEPFFGAQKGRRFRLRLETLRFYAHDDHGESGYDFKKEFSQDLAAVRLDLDLAVAKYGPIEFHPYALLAPPAAPAQSGLFLLSAVDGGPATTYDFSPALQTCGVRDRDSVDGDTVMNLFTDCDVQNTGPSGGGLLQMTPQGFAVVGVLAGYYGKKPGPYGKTGNSTVFVGLTEAARKWILLEDGRNF